MERKQIMAHDCGYGFTKGKHGARMAVFPSVAGDAVSGDFDNELITTGRGMTLTLDGQEWFYGEHAQKHSRNPVALFARERTEQRDLMRVLFCAALAELGITQGTVSLATGLPVDWFADKDELESLLRGAHVFKIDDKPCSVFVSQVVTVPQPFGSFFDAILDSDGKVINPDFARGKVGILDVGTFTCDLALSDGLEYIAKSSGSKTAAMSIVWQQVADGIKARYGLEYELHKIDDIMRNGRTVTVNGQDRRIDDLVQPAVNALAQQVIGFARDRWGKARDFRRVILTGGGAYYLADEIKAVYPHALVLSEPHTGNLRGFYKYAARKFGR